MSEQEIKDEKLRVLKTLKFSISSLPIWTTQEGEDAVVRFDVLDKIDKLSAQIQQS